MSNLGVERKICKRLSKLCRKEGIELAQPFNAVATTWSQVGGIIFLCNNYATSKNNFELLPVLYGLKGLSHQIINAWK
jgi:hypothetical protein